MLAYIHDRKGGTKYVTLSVECRDSYNKYWEFVFQSEVSNFITYLDFFLCSRAVYYKKSIALGMMTKFDDKTFQTEIKMSEVFQI